jgi:hypothetical protein
MLAEVMISFKFWLPEERKRLHEARGHGAVETPLLILGFLNISINRVSLVKVKLSLCTKS